MNCLPLPSLGKTKSEWVCSQSECSSCTWDSFTVTRRVYIVYSRLSPPRGTFQLIRTTGDTRGVQCGGSWQTLAPGKHSLIQSQVASYWSVSPLHSPGEQRELPQTLLKKSICEGVEHTVQARTLTTPAHSFLPPSTSIQSQEEGTASLTMRVGSTPACPKGILSLGLKNPLWLLRRPGAAF